MPLRLRWINSAREAGGLLNFFHRNIVGRPERDIVIEHLPKLRTEFGLNFVIAGRVHTSLQRSADYRPETGGDFSSPLLPDVRKNDKCRCSSQLSFSAIRGESGASK
jgi:hypothetical protein